MFSVLMSMMDIFKLIVIFAFIFIIVKMSQSHTERMAKIKRGYPLDESKRIEGKEYVDLRGDSSSKNNGN